MQQLEETYGASATELRRTYLIITNADQQALDLPATAIGKDYLGRSVFGAAPSGSGYQLSLGGLLGVTASGVDGFELNVLGLNLGVSTKGVKHGRLTITTSGAELK